MAPRSQPHPHPLPTALSTFIGRDHELAEVQRLLRTTRLLTLTGPGGCGKTRLALRAAAAVRAEFEDGVWLTEFAPLAEAGLVPQAVATTLGVHEQPGRPLSETIAAHLGDGQALLIFDNCEHLVAACAALAEALLQACPNLHILATSRETLNLPGETSWLVPPLSLPEQQPWRSTTAAQQALNVYEQSEAVRLFVDRATAAAPDFRLTIDNGPWVAEICRRLDGMPLALELAAARVRALSARQIAERLAERDRFRLLTGGSRTAPLRQQSLAATLDWSYSLLAASEKKLLQWLGVFAGGWTLEAAEAIGQGGEVAPGDVVELLAHLVDKSLVQTDQAAGEMRYRLLETIRQYALGRLAEAGEETEWRDRHLDYFILWAENADHNLTGPEALVWLRRFEAEHDNLRGGLAWALTAEDKAPKGLQLAGAAGHFWRLHGYHSEGRLRLATALAQAGADGTENWAARVRALIWAGALAVNQSDYPAARAACQACLAMCREMGEAGQLDLAQAVILLAEVDVEEGDYAAALPRFEEAVAIFRQLGDSVRLSDALTMLSWLAMRAGDGDKAAVRFDEALAHSRSLGHPGLIAQALAGRAELAVRQGEYPLATALLQEGLDLSRQLGEAWGIGVALGSLGWVALRQGDFSRMRELLGESLSVRLASGDAGGSAWCLERLAEAAVLQAQAFPVARRGPAFQRAARIFGAAAALRARLNAVVDRVDVSEFERQVATLRAGLGEAVFSDAWAAGSHMTLEQTAAYALAEPQSPAGDATQLAGVLAEGTFGGLTARERQVAALIAQGQSNRKIAEALVVSTKTVETYVTRILGKLGFDSRVQIATWAVEKGLAVR